MPRKAPLITLSDLRQRFHRPLADVALEFGVCLSYMKKLCRANDIKRWPYRHIQSLHTRAGKLKKFDAGEAVRAVEKHIQRIQAQTGTESETKSYNHWLNPFTPTLPHPQAQFWDQQRQMQGLNQHRNDCTNRNEPNGSPVWRQRSAKEEGCHLPPIAYIHAGVESMQMMNEQTQIKGQKRSRGPSEGDYQNHASVPGLQTKFRKTGREERFDNQNPQAEALTDYMMSLQPSKSGPSCIATSVDTSDSHIALSGSDGQRHQCNHRVSGQWGNHNAGSGSHRQNDSASAMPTVNSSLAAALGLTQYHVFH